MKKNERFFSQFSEFINERWELRTNVITRRVEFRDVAQNGNFVELDDYTTNTLWCDLLKNGIYLHVNEVRNMLFSALSPVYNPFTEYLFPLRKKWDGKTDYIKNLGNMVKTTDQEMWELCFPKWFVAMVASAMKEEVINHTVLIFRSDKQGIGKTTFFSRLLPEELRMYYYSGVSKFDSRDTQIALFQNLLINLDELDALSNSESNRLKEMITKSTIQARRAYGHDIENYTRNASFCGSTNSKHFLSDLTGARRFLCFDVLEIDYMSEIDYENVYAQAVALVEQGFEYWLNVSEIETVSKMNEVFRLRTPEEEYFYSFFEKPSHENANETHIWLSASEIMTKITGRTGFSITNAAKINIGKLLHKEGFTFRISCGINKYFVVEKSDKKIEDERKRKGDNDDNQSAILF